MWCGESVESQDVHDPRTADAQSVSTGEEHLGGVQTVQGQVAAVDQPQGGGQLHHVVPHQLLRKGGWAEEQFRDVQ